MSRQLGRSDSRARNEPNTFVMEVENDQVEVNRNSSESESDSNSNRSNNIHTPVNHQMVPLETLRADADQRIAPLLEKMDNLTAEVQWLRRKCSSRERRRRASTERRHSRERSRKRRNRRHHEESSSSDSSSEEERYRRKGKEDTASAKGQAVKKTTEEAIKEEDWKQIVKVNTKINLWEKKEQGNLLKEK